MQVEITGEVERMIQAALASGQYASAEQFIAAMAADWNRQQGGGVTAVMPPMPDHIDLSSLLSEQNIKPCEDPLALATDIWPKDESTDDFLAFLQETRHDQGAAGEVP
jgi:hypothetical protein